MNIKWRSNVFYPSGYAMIARHFIKYLTKYGVGIELHPLSNVRDNMTHNFDFVRLTKNRFNDAKIGIQFLTPDLVDHNFSKYVINKTLFELDGIPKFWVSEINRKANELWIPDVFNRSIFLGSGAKVPSYIIPYGINSDVFYPKETSMQIKNAKGFVFLSNFQWTFRKGWDVLLDAYMNEFTSDDDVCLVLKVYGAHMTDDSKNNIKNIILNRYRRSKAPKVLIFGNFLLDESLVNLYRASDCFVLPSRGEGWGVPYMEAMACGLPTIGTNWSANTCFMNSKNSYLIKVNGFEHPKNMGWIPWYQSPLRWAEPSVKHLRYLMRYVFEHKKDARKKGEQARRDIVNYWKWDTVIQKCIGRLNQIA